jgi:chromosome segregation ATPase
LPGCSGKPTVHGFVIETARAPGGLIRLADRGAPPRGCDVVMSAMADSPPSVPAAAGNEAMPAELEMRQVKEAVTALRAKLEEAQALRDAAVQVAVAAAQDELRQLQLTIQALRDELQTTQAEKDRAVQAAVAAGKDEVRQLHQTISALRTQLETAMANARADLDAQAASHHHELRQLRETIVTLRDQLEKANVR